MRTSASILRRAPLNFLHWTALASRLFIYQLYDFCLVTIMSLSKLLRSCSVVFFSNPRVAFQFRKAFRDRDLVRTNCSATIPFLLLALFQTYSIRSVPEICFVPLALYLTRIVHAVYWLAWSFSSQKIESRKSYALMCRTVHVVSLARTSEQY